MTCNQPARPHFGGPVLRSRTVSQSLPSAGRTLNVLHVDDDPMNLRVVEEILSAFGHNTVKASSGRRGARAPGPSGLRRRADGHQHARLGRHRGRRSACVSRAACRATLRPSPLPPISRPGGLANTLAWASAISSPSRSSSRAWSGPSCPQPLTTRRPATAQAISGWPSGAALNLSHFSSTKGRMLRRNQIGGRSDANLASRLSARPEADMAEDSSPEHARLIRKLETIAVLSNAEKQGLASIPLRLKSFQENTDLSREGEAPTECCLVIDGLVCRYKVLGAGQRQIHVAATCRGTSRPAEPAPGRPRPQPGVADGRAGRLSAPCRRTRPDRPVSQHHRRLVARHPDRRGGLPRMAGLASGAAARTSAWRT